MYAALSYHIGVRHERQLLSEAVCGLKLLVYAALSYHIGVRHERQLLSEAV